MIEDSDYYINGEDIPYVSNTYNDSGFVGMFINWLAGVVLVYSFLFGTGSFLFGDTIKAFIFLISGLVSIVIIYRNLSAAGWKTLIK